MIKMVHRSICEPTDITDAVGEGGSKEGVETGGDPRLGQRAVRAGAWNFLLNFTVGILSFLRLVVIARLITPSDFGVFSITLVIITGLDTFTYTGLDAALIQRKAAVEDYLDTVWLIHLARGVLLALALLLFAQPVATWFDTPDAVALLRVMAFAPLLKGFENIGIVLLPRELEFDKRFRLQISETVADVLVSIIIVLVLRNAFALVGGLVAGRAARLLASYMIHTYRPRLQFHSGRVRELFRYGRWVFLNNIFGFVALRGDKAIIGKLLGPVSLGAYEFAWRISEFVTRSMSVVIAEVVFPTYAKIQGQQSRLQSAYLVVLETVAVIVLPAGMALTILARPLTELILGPKWAPIGAVLPFLVWAGVTRSITGTCGPLFMAVGKPVRDFVMNAIGLGVIFALLVPMAKRGGLIGASQAIFVGTLTTIPLFVHWLGATLGIRPKRMVLALIPSIVVGGVTMIPAWIMLHLAGIDSLEELTAVGVAMTVTYVACTFLLWKLTGAAPLRYLRQLLSLELGARRLFSSSTG